MPSHRNLFIALPIAALSFAMLPSCETLQDLPTERIASTRLTLANGVPAGTAQLLASGERITLTVVATGMAPGEHGLHLHQTGECKRPDFTSAGGHLNPGSKTHGSLSAGGAHLGDLPNLVIGNGGTGTLTVDIMATRDEALAAIFDSDGTAVVVHAGADDYKTDPSGDAGSRIACGVLNSAE